jgi:hypothetical protein
MKITELTRPLHRYLHKDFKKLVCIFLRFMLFIMNFLSLDQFKPGFKLLEIESTNDMAATRGSHGRRPHWISGAARDLGHGLAGGQVNWVERPKAVAQATGTQRHPRQNGFF